MLESAVDSLPPEGERYGRPVVTVRGLVTPLELKAFGRPSGWRAARDLGLIWLQVVAAAGLYVVYPAWWTYAAAFVLIAGGQHGLALATHEFVHYSVLPGNRRVNDFVGGWFFGAPVGIPLAIFRHRHFEHHRTYSTEADPKIVYRRSLRGAKLPLEIVRGVSGFEFVHHALVAQRQHVRIAASGTRSPVLWRALPSLLTAQAAMALAFAAAGNPWLYVTLWLLPLVTLTQLLQTLRAIIEHRPPDDAMGAMPGSGYYGDTPGPFVRTVRATWWERLLVCKLNFGFHAEHHLWPQVSYQYLPELRQRLEGAGAFDDPRFGRDDTYSATIVKLWRPPAHPS
jgi:fatty acid desaturase